MTRKQNKPSFKYYLSLTLLVVVLASLFVYTSFNDGKYFIFFIVILVISLGILLFFRYKSRSEISFIVLERQDYQERLNVNEADIAKEAETIKSWQQKIINFSYLKDVVEKLCLCLSLSDTSKTLCIEANRFFGHLDVTTILYLFHPQTGQLALSCSQKGDIQINLKTKTGDAFDAWVTKARQALLIEDTKRDFRFDSDQPHIEGQREIRSVISVPLTSGQNTLGILRVDCSAENAFSTEDLQLLVTLGDVGAVAIDNALLYERVEDLAIHDGLTGLYLRRHLLDRMTQELSRVLRNKKELSFLMIDLDHFKKYNDQYGHVAGDILLRTIGTLLSDFFHEPGNLICRYGGEEFAVLLPECSKKRAIELAQAVRKQIETQEIFLRRIKTSITVSIGVASFPHDAQVRDELIQSADKALYEAKAKGRNRVWPVKG